MFRHPATALADATARACCCHAVRDHDALLPARAAAARGSQPGAVPLLCGQASQTAARQGSRRARGTEHGQWSRRISDCNPNQGRELHLAKWQGDIAQSIPKAGNWRQGWHHWCQRSGEVDAAAPVRGYT
eukprot:6204228-Pleurochrysis_carterae.AAC.1